MIRPDFKFGPHDPIRVTVAAKIAFPDGSMTASGLRREARRGNLVIERVAGRDYTTLERIAAMREKCRIPIRSKQGRQDTKPLPSKTAAIQPAQGAARVTALRLKKLGRAS